MSVPILGPLADVPEVQDNLAKPIEAGLPAQNQVLIHVVHVILQERVNLWRLRSCCNNLWEFNVDPSNFVSQPILRLDMNLICKCRSLDVVHFQLFLLVAPIFSLRLRLTLIQSSNMTRHCSHLLAYLLPCRFPPAQG